jgi:hypothetical protein
MEWTLAISLREGGDGEAVSSVFSEDGEVEERRLPCTWQADGDVVTVHYETGESERFRFSDAVPFESAGLSGSAPGLQPLEGDDAYPVSDGQTLWLASEVEIRLEALQSRH